MLAWGQSVNFGHHNIQEKYKHWVSRYSMIQVCTNRNERKRKKLLFPIFLQSPFSGADAGRWHRCNCELVSSGGGSRSTRREPSLTADEIRWPQTCLWKIVGYNDIWTHARYSIWSLQDQRLRPLGLTGGWKRFPTKINMELWMSTQPIPLQTAAD